MTADIDLDPCLPGRQVFTTAVIAPDLSDMADEIFDGNAFNGVFDGADRKIYNLTIDTNGLGKDYLGFFGEIHKSGEIKNLGIENVRLSGTRSEFPVNSTYCAGGLAGNNNGNISRCYSTGSIAEGTSAGWWEKIAGLSMTAALQLPLSSVTMACMLADWSDGMQVLSIIVSRRVMLIMVLAVAAAESEALRAAILV
jgi:hypothetical protein